jgi:DNA-binding transcriptional ArsR family regulator
MSSIRRQGLQDLQELIKNYPGQPPEFYKSKIIAMYGIRKETASEWLQTLAEAGLIEAHGMRIYPKGLSPEKEDIKKEQALLKMLREKAGGVIDEVKEDATRITETATPVTPPPTPRIQEQNRYYLLFYDLDSKIPKSERVTIYRKLNKVYHQLLREGVYVERIQMSVWKVQGKENAQKLASVLPEHATKIRIFEVLGEER